MTKYLMILAALFALVACGGDDNNDSWTTYAGLEWSPLSEKAMIWQEAVDYCEAMDARLPTIDELRKIMINCPGSAYGGPCQVSDPDCLAFSCQVNEDCRCDGSAESYSALGDAKDYISIWSSSSHAYNTNLVWLVGFYYGNVFNSNKYSYYPARCVR